VARPKYRYVSARLRRKGGGQTKWQSKRSAARSFRAVQLYVRRGSDVVLGKLYIAVKAKAAKPDPASTGLTVRERVLLFCAASGTEWQHGGVKGEAVTAIVVKGLVGHVGSPNRFQQLRPEKSQRLHCWRPSARHLRCLECGVSASIPSPLRRSGPRRGF
jgi:hypothetical protein